MYRFQHARESGRGCSTESHATQTTTTADTTTHSARVYFGAQSCCVISDPFFASRCWTTKMFAEGSGRATTNQQRASSRSFAPCRCDQTRAGIRYNLTCLTLRGALMAPIMWRRCACKFMQIVAFGGSTSVIGSIRRMSCQPSSSCSYPYRSRNPPKPLCLSSRATRFWGERLLHRPMPSVSTQTLLSALYLFRCQKLSMSSLPPSDPLPPFLLPIF